MRHVNTVIGTKSPRSVTCTSNVSHAAKISLRLAQGWGTYLISQVAWIVHYRWRAAKSYNFILKF